VRVTATATPSTPTSATHELTPTPTLTPAPTPTAISAAIPRHGDAYDSQGHAPPPQQQHRHTPSSHSHAYPHPESNPGPSTDLRPRPHAYQHAHAHADRMKESPSESPAPSSSQPQRRWNGPRPQTYERGHRTALPPRFHERPHDHRERDRNDDDERHRGGQLPARPEADHDDGYRYANTYTTHSPGHSEEQPRWLTTPSDGTGQRLSQSRSQSPGSGHSRGYAGYGSADDVRGGR